MSLTSCAHDYCPHQHFNKCLNARLQSIPYTIFPDATIDSFTNLPSKSANLYKSSVPTAAYEKYTVEHGASARESNFVKNYYYNKEANGEQLGNRIVEELQEQMAAGSAYVLAGLEAEKFREWDRKRKGDIHNARCRAVSRYNEHFKERDQQRRVQNEENEKWLKKLYRKLEEVAKHIIEGEGETLGDRERKFLLSKASLTPTYLSKIKVRDPKTAFEIMQQLRTLMLKKKLRFEQQRQEQEQNKSVSMSFASESGTQNTSQNSMMSQATSLNESKAFGEDQVVGKYFDFEALRKKWDCRDLEEVKQIIRRVLTNEVVGEAEVAAVKKQKQALKNNENIRRNQTQQKNKSVGKSKKQPSKPKKKQDDITKKVVAVKTSLSGQDEAIKVKLLKGGHFDAVGQKFERTRNFSLMFKRKQQQNLVQFEIKDKTLSFTKDTMPTR